MYEVRGGLLLIIGVEWYTDPIRENLKIHIYYQNQRENFYKMRTDYSNLSYYILYIYNRTDTIAVITALKNKQ